MLRILISCIVFVAACQPAPTRDESQPQHAPPVAPAPALQPVVHYDNVPYPPLPDEIRYGALADASPEHLRAMIERHGAQLVIRSLWGETQDQGWARVEHGIASGEQEWLDLVPLLRTAADGHASETLSIAVSDALIYNAPGVLRLIEPRDPARLVCRFGHVEPTRAEFTEYYAAAARAVEAVTTADLQSVRRDCLTALQRNQAEGLQFVR